MNYPKIQRIIVEYVNKYVNGLSNDHELLLPHEDVNDKRYINIDSSGVKIHHAGCTFGAPQDKKPEDGEWVECPSWWAAVEHCLALGRKFGSGGHCKG